MGSHEIKGGLKAAQHDENTVVWAHKNQNKNAAEIIEYINNYNNSDSQANNNVNIIQSDNYDKLIKLKKLLDDNIITQEEFEKEKTKLLG
ncbi:MAG TPA: hypothetical protein DCE23_04235 [Firmicutes bacterium]|nr:hypothetical protein [Bacillota bacterium]